MRLHFTTLSTCIVLTTSIGAYAQGSEDSEAADPPAAEASAEADAETPTAPGADTTTSAKGPLTSEAGAHGGRFRFGVALGAGPLSTDGIDMTYYGADLRLVGN